MTYFERVFGRAPTARGEAFGRVNLIGEHTDYNGGFVLPTAIPQRTIVSLHARADGKVRVSSQGNGDEIVEYALGSESRKGKWSDYLEGITHVLELAGHRVGGVELAIESDVPMGSGLSSSAALEVAVIRALRAAFDYDIDDVEIARLCQRVENEFVGARVGIMDPMAASLAEPGVALFLDTRDLSFHRLKLPVDRMDHFVINSGVKHSNVGGGYNERRAQCEAAAEQLGVKELRDLGMSDLARIESLADPLRRRARHVVTENERVMRAVRAIQDGNARELGKLFVASHASLRDDYEVSIPEIDMLVDIACSEPGVYGARLTGGGFGGSIVGVCERGAGGKLAQTIAEKYALRSGRQPTVVVP